MNTELKYEFKVDLKPVRHKSRRYYMAKISNEPRLRQYLVLAYQIQDALEKNTDTSLLQVAGWLNMTYTRIKQITNLLLLCPGIQKELLLLNTDKIRQLTERKIRDIAKEIDWQKQLSTWNNLTH
ncbi:MAG: hypothetical protein NTZ95_01150 [Candidatus Omnitrophica bacterium]|nr:hypothetical protein [Candidatus Omnitrophota bacterium]